jgi:hypothetical protein
MIKLKEIVDLTNCNKQFLEKRPPIEEVIKECDKYNFAAYKDLKEHISIKLSLKLTQKIVKNHNKLFECYTPPKSVILNKYEDIVDDFNSEIKEIGNKLRNQANIWNVDSMFIRTEEASLKSCRIKDGRVNDNQTFLANQDIEDNIMKSLISSDLSHCPFGFIKPNECITLLIIKPVIIVYEYRVFVYKGKITAMSPQLWFKNSTAYSDITLAQKVVVYLEKDIIPPLIERGLNSVVIDVGLIRTNSLDLEPYFIEINPFGIKYTSGSALFNWEEDEDILFDGNEITLAFYQG